jgi:hypothetical protein
MKSQKDSVVQREVNELETDYGPSATNCTAYAATTTATTTTTTTTTTNNNNNNNNNNFLFIYVQT